MAYVLSFRGFNEVTSQNGNWYQSWSGSTPTVNSGSSGLQNFGVFFDQNLVGALDLCLDVRQSCYSSKRQQYPPDRCLV